MFKIFSYWTLEKWDGKKLSFFIAWTVLSCHETINFVIFLHKWRKAKIYSEFVSLGVSTVETNRDRDFSMCRDIIFQTVETFSTVEMSVFELSRSRVSIETLTKIETLGHKPCWDFIFWTVETSLNSRDQFLKPVKIFSTVEINF